MYHKWAKNAEGQRGSCWGPGRREKGCHFSIRTRLNTKRTVYCGGRPRRPGALHKGQRGGEPEGEAGFLMQFAFSRTCKMRVSRCMIVKVNSGGRKQHCEDEKATVYIASYTFLPQKVKYRSARRFPLYLRCKDGLKAIGEWSVIPSSQN